MRYVTSLSAALLMMLTSTVLANAQPRAASADKPGGVLRPVLREDLPQGFYSNLNCCRLQETWVDK